MLLPLLLLLISLDAGIGVGVGGRLGGGGAVGENAVAVGTKTCERIATLLTTSGSPPSCLTL